MSTSFNMRKADLNDPSAVSERISGENSEKNLKTSRSKREGGDPRDVTLFSMSQILLGLPAQRSEAEVLAMIQAQIFGAFNTISDTIEGFGLGGLIPESIRDALSANSASNGSPGSAFSIYDDSGSVPNFPGNYTGGEKRSIRQAVSTARNEVGYQESPPGSNNTKYAAIAGVKSGQPWCATFLMAIMKEAGFDQDRLITPSTTGTYERYKEVGRTGKDPKVGAIAFMSYGSSGINHAGLVVSVGQSTIKTIEGNTSPSTSGVQYNGGVVDEKTRQRSKIVAYAYPVYPDADRIAQLEEAQRAQAAGGGFNPGSAPSGKSYMWHTAESATSDSGGARPGASALMSVVLSTFQDASNLGIYAFRNVRGASSLSVHSEGRALDIGVEVSSAGEAVGNNIFNVLANAAWPLGIQRIIWNRRIWQKSDPAGKAYSGQNPHVDHLHVEMTRSAATNLNESQIRSILNIPSGTVA